MKTLIALLLLASPAWAGRTLTITAPASVTVGDTILVSYDLPTSGQAVNLLAVRTEWNEALASFHSWKIGGCVFTNPLSLPCNTNAQGKMKFSTTGQSATAAGHIATMKLIASATGNLTLAFGNGCPNWESTPTFYNAGIIVPTDAFTSSLTVTITGNGTGCSPDPCELEKPRTSSTWGTVKGIFR